MAESENSSRRELRNRAKGLSGESSWPKETAGADGISEGETPESATSSLEREDPEATEPTRLDKRTRRRRKIALVSTGLVALLAGFGIGSFWQVYTVPSAPPMDNQLEVQEETACGHFDFGTCSVSWETSSSVERGKLISQSVGPGTVFTYRSRAIHLTYSAGPEKATMPDLLGEDAESAGKKLFGLGLNVGSVELVNDAKAEPGTVVSQSVESGEKLSNGATINLKVAADSVEIPKFEGLTYAEALVAAEELGVELTLPDGVEAKDSDTVISQFPAEGEAVEQSSSVAITLLDSGEEAKKVAIPKIIGDSKEAGQKKLLDAGFKDVTLVEVSSSEVNEEQITQVVPGEGQKLSTATNIVVIVSKPVS